MFISRWLPAGAFVATRRMRIVVRVVAGMLVVGVTVRVLIRGALGIVGVRVVHVRVVHVRVVHVRAV